MSDYVNVFMVIVMTMTFVTSIILSILSFILVRMALRILLDLRQEPEPAPAASYTPPLPPLRHHTDRVNYSGNGYDRENV
jgi:hypothetical protein